MNTDPSSVRELISSHYFLFAFLASLGTLQISVTISGARGLWLTPHRMTTRVLGFALIATAVVVFFTQPLWIEGPWAAGSVEADSVSREWGTASWDELAGARNVNDIHGGLDGIDQAVWFPLAVGLALLVSIAAGAITMVILNAAEPGISRAGESDSDKQVDGLAGLEHRSYFSNLPGSFRNLRSELSGVWQSGLSSADRWSVIKVIFGRSSG